VNAKEVLSQALATYPFALPRHGAEIAVGKMLKRLKNADADSARAFARIHPHFHEDVVGINYFVLTLVDACERAQSGKAIEVEANATLDKVKQARKAIDTLKAVAPFVDGSYIGLEIGFDKQFAPWISSIAEAEWLASSDLEAASLNRQRRAGYLLSAALRFLVHRIDARAPKASNPDIAKLASVIFNETIDDERVRKVRRDLATKREL
jgi:hypothetical protein